MNIELLDRILIAVLRESERAAKRKPLDIYRDPYQGLRILAEEFGEVAESLNPLKGPNDKGNMDEELVQVASVAVNWLYQRELQRGESHAVSYESKFKSSKGQPSPYSDSAGSTMGVRSQGFSSGAPLQEPQDQVGSPDRDSKRGSHGDVAGRGGWVPAEDATVTDRVGGPGYQADSRGGSLRPPEYFSSGNRTYKLINWDGYSGEVVYRLQSQLTPTRAHGASQTGEPSPRDRGDR